MNSNIKITDKETLSDDKYNLHRYTLNYRTREGEIQVQIRDVFDQGNGAAILLYNVDQRTVILTRQFRLPAYVNGSEDGMLIEACAGMLDGDLPEVCIKREALEETGIRVEKVTKVFEAYMSPGALTELLYFYIAEYKDEDKVGKGGGLDHEQENIEVVEMSFVSAFKMISDGLIQDAKTIMLLQYLKIQDVFAEAD